MKRWIAGLAVGALLVGCTGQPSAEEIVRRTQSAMENVKHAHAVVEVEATVQGETVRVVGEGWMDGERKRATVLEASEAELVGTLAVSDGETGWLYHPDMDKVLTGEWDALETYWEAEQGDAPTGIDLNSLTETVDELLRITDESLVGTETIAGLEAWHLQLTPNAEAPREWVAAGGVVELWVSTKYDVPLQVQYSGSSLGTGRITVREYEPEATFSDELFRFTPPAGAEVVDVATLLPETMTLPEARERAGFPLLSTAQDSTEAALTEVARIGEGYMQRFEGSLGAWTLLQSATLPEHTPAPDAQPADGKAETQAVSLRGTEGRIRHEAEGGHTTVIWQENGVFLVLSGQLSQEAALKLAAGLR